MASLRVDAIDLLKIDVEGAELVSSIEGVTDLRAYHRLQGVARRQSKIRDTWHYLRWLVFQILICCWTCRHGSSQTQS